MQCHVPGCHGEAKQNFISEVPKLALCDQHHQEYWDTHQDHIDEMQRRYAADETRTLRA